MTYGQLIGSLWAIAPRAEQRLLLLLQSGRETSALTGSFSSSSSRPRVSGEPGNRTSVIPVSGILTRDESGWGSTYTGIAEAAERAAADKSVQRIVLDVDSTGGEVAGLKETAALMAQVNRVKPVFAMVHGTAASAAFVLASQAREIHLTPSGEVGDVGVVAIHADVSGALDDAGVKITELSSGKYKTEQSPYQPLSKGAASEVTSKVVAAHNDMLGFIRSGRGSRASREMQRTRFGEGRMFSGPEALRHGLVDSLQSRREFYKSLTEPRDAEQDNVAYQRRRLAVAMARARM
jgi:signal peptide peptidase SppA